MDIDDIKIAVEAAHVMANRFQETVVLLDDLNVKRQSEKEPTDRVLEVFQPCQRWQV